MQVIDMSKLNRYLLSIENLKAMYKDGLIDAKDYQKAESFLAKKYCIKKVSLYRANDLMQTGIRCVRVDSAIDFIRVWMSCSKEMRLLKLPFVE